ncbi:MAG: glycosyltransferase family 2 protein [Spirochaetia bacterium]|nr:glycosyltransferase family 2 protein [Spirochaetia bacterium]
MRDSDYVVVIPVYNHGSTVMPLADFFTEKKLPLILVDDGSNEKTKEYLRKVKEKYPSVTLITLARNGGKGAAVLAGLDEAASQGYSYILQVDADGQHDVLMTDSFLDASCAHPDAVICGYPVYDHSVPAIRKIGRKLTCGMVVAETWSHDIKDAMCGFRIYPVKSVFRVKDDIRTFRMGFDLEVMVRMAWLKIPVISMPVRVTYPQDGISNFRMFRDNLEISRIHTALFIGKLWRSIRHG